MTTNQVLYERMNKSFVTDENCSEGIDNSSNVKNGAGIYRSCSTHNSVGIYCGIGIEESTGVRNGTNISHSNAIYNSTTIRNSVGISWSENIYNSNGINNSTGLNKCHGMNNSLFCEKIKGGSNCVLCYGLQGAYSMIFNKKVSEERLEEVYLKLFSYYWEPDFTNKKELFEKFSGEWGKIPAQTITGRSKKEAYSEMPKEMIDYIKSLPEYDTEIFKAITGLEE